MHNFSELSPLSLQHSINNVLVYYISLTLSAYLNPLKFQVTLDLQLMMGRS